MENNVDIKSISNCTWKKYIREKVKCVALKQIKLENQSKEKIKSIPLKEMRMCQYLEENLKLELSKIILMLDQKLWT